MTINGQISHVEEQGGGYQCQFGLFRGNNPQVFSKVIGMGKASSDNPLVVYKGKGKSKGRASSDNPRALFNEQLPPSSHSKKTRSRGGQVVIFTIFFMSNSSIYNQGFTEEQLRSIPVDNKAGENYFGHMSQQLRSKGGSAFNAISDRLVLKSS